MQLGGEITVHAYKKPEFVVIKIIDSGSGMTKEQLERLGTPFYSMKEKGTGIGLMVCYNIIEKYKGKIEVESTVGKGTTFSIYIPLYRSLSNK
ncbi:sensor histidine kinase [Bacillus taeanensis]|uniref:histidine kinase n=1 Tax=Bacillus taeanensis TaxID=273032 RepID=A0A366Y2Z2_9BACI|nr:HAMP domain-containing sensor histidine kinase [Bacillus taeanensis]RBW70754.1 hypothetical protein DS031_04535 [Bacillus taeanensis]